MSKKSLAKNILSLGIVQVANFVMPLISVPIISRIIGPDKFGAINYVGAIVVYFNLFIGFGFNLTATRRISQDPHNQYLKNKVFSEVFCSQALLFVVSMGIFGLLLFFLPNLASDKRMALFAFLFCISSVLTQNWFFQAMQDMSKITILNLLGKVLYLVAVLSLIREKEDYFWQPLSLSVTQIIVGILSFQWVIRKYQLRLSMIPLKRCWELLRQEKAVFFSIAFTTLYTTANIVILGLFQSDEQVGYYTAGQRLILVAQSVIVLPLSQVFYPYIAKNFKEGREVGVETVQKLLPIVFFFTGAMGIGIVVLGPYALELFYGDSFLPAIPVFQILAFVPMINAINNILGVQLMLNMKMDSQYLKAIAVCASLSIFTNLYMANQWSYIGCAYNWLLTEICITGFMFVIILREGIQPIQARFFTPSSILGYLQPVKDKLFKKSARVKTTSTE